MTFLIRSTILFSLLVLISCNQDEAKQDPQITWDNPADIKQGAPLGDAQLNASANVPGTFTYEPPAGTVLEEGNDIELMATFTPDQPDEYNTTTRTVLVNVIPNGTSSANFNENLSYGVVVDADGNAYKTIEIGDQIWMAQNLRTTIFQNGDAIEAVTSNAEWTALSGAAYCNYENSDSLDDLATYGRLYNWFAINDPRNIAPEGWHVATQEDWDELARELGGDASAGGPLKEAGLHTWNSPNTAASNSSGFTALPSGRREYSDGRFINRGFNGFWWTNSPYNPDYSWYYQLNYDFGYLLAANFHKQYGFTVRCVKNAE